MTDITIDTSAETNKLVESPIPSATTAPSTDFSNNKEAFLDTPPPSVKPTQQAFTNGKGFFSYTSPNINFEDDPPTYLKTKVESLIYWEHPKTSAAYLLGSFSILILTQYFSVLQIMAGLFTLVTGVNWVFVNCHKQGQRFIGGKSSSEIANPHSARLEHKRTYVPRDRVLRTAQLTIDVVEVITQQITKLVLIQDNWKSATSLVISYLVWTLAKYVSTKYILGFFIIIAFSVPRLYLQHQELVDGHVAQQSKNARVLAEKYGGVATQKAKELTTQATAFIKSKTSGVTTKATSMTEKKD